MYEPGGSADLAPGVNADAAVGEEGLASHEACVVTCQERGDTPDVQLGSTEMSEGHGLPKCFLFFLRQSVKPFQRSLRPVPRSRADRVNPDPDRSPLSGRNPSGSPDPLLRHGIGEHIRPALYSSNRS